MARFNIRSACENDAADLSRTAYESKSYWGYSKQQLKLWRDQLTITASDITKHHCFVAEVDKNIAGFYLLIANKPYWDLEHFWVIPEFMAKGIGKALLKHAVQQAKNCAMSSIYIDADPNAEAFYLHCGSQRVGEVPAAIAAEPTRIRPQLVLHTGL